MESGSKSFPFTMKFCSKYFDALSPVLIEGRAAPLLPRLVHNVRLKTNPRALVLLSERLFGDFCLPARNSCLFLQKSGEPSGESSRC
jgi:hypothetical protein